jgi:hypothetical protein
MFRIRAVMQCPANAPYDITDSLPRGTLNGPAFGFGVFSSTVMIRLHPAENTT